MRSLRASEALHSILSTRRSFFCDDICFMVLLALARPSWAPAHRAPFRKAHASDGDSCRLQSLKSPTVVQSHNINICGDVTVLRHIAVYAMSRVVSRELYLNLDAFGKRTWCDRTSHHRPRVSSSACRVGNRARRCGGLVSSSEPQTFTCHVKVCSYGGGPLFCCRTKCGSA